MIKITGDKLNRDKKLQLNNSWKLL